MKPPTLLVVLISVDIHSSMYQWMDGCLQSRWCSFLLIFTAVCIDGWMDGMFAVVLIALVFHMTSFLIEEISDRGLYVWMKPLIVLVVLSSVVIHTTYFFD